MAKIAEHAVSEWSNYHFNGPFPTRTIIEIENDRTAFPDAVARFNDAASGIRSLLQKSIDQNERFRAYGSAWSLSNIAHQRDRMLFNANLNIKLPVSAAQMQPGSAFSPENLFLFQCGNIVKEITEYLEQRGKSLQASGASNGQTIAGAISTGVHGSAIDVGSIQDSVVGIQLITGPGAEDVLYLEAASRPALNDVFAGSINARVVRNDALFNAALVGLGAFGVIHGVVLEAENIYLLKRYVKKIKQADALALAENLDFAQAAFRIPEEVNADGTMNRPYHYKLYINPYNAAEDFVAEVIYKKAYRTDYPNPVPLIQKWIFKDIPIWIASLAARHNWIIPKIVGALKSEAFPKLDEITEGTLGDIFWDTSQSSAAFGCAFGISNQDTSRAVHLFTDIMNTKGPIPGILSARFVKGTRATLGFTRFENTCILEVDGIPWKENPQMLSLDAFLIEVIKVFKSNGIVFTLHWGKNAPWSYPGLIDTMYGDADDKWKEMRSILLTKQMADLFSNDFLDTVKLSDYRLNGPADFVALKSWFEGLPRV